MCEQCEAIQRRIDTYRRIYQDVSDPLSAGLFVLTIEDLEKEKRELHSSGGIASSPKSG